MFILLYNYLNCIDVFNLDLNSLKNEIDTLISNIDNLNITMNIVDNEDFKNISDSDEFKNLINKSKTTFSIGFKGNN